jgi:hypothetical protein
MREDDTAFTDAYRALMTIERSLTVRRRMHAWVRQVQPIRVRFRQDHLLAQQASRAICTAKRFCRVGREFLHVKHPDASVLPPALSPAKPARWARAGL